jgi:hypothetical protein
MLQDIQELLKGWQEELDDCERIWVRANWANRGMFMIDNGGVFDKGAPESISSILC